MPNLASVDGAGVGGGAPAVGQETNRKSRKRRVSAEGGGGEEDAKAAGGINEYKCRFCLMKFEKSQALGGHMNRHRQEREKEQFQHAQQIVSFVAHQQMPQQTWSSLTAEVLESPSGPSNGGVPTRLGSQLSRGANRQQYVAPSISSSLCASFARPGAQQLPPSLGSNCNNYYLPSLPSNASSCNVQGGGGSSNHQHHQQWIGSMDGFSNAASNSPRSVSFHHPVELSLQAAGVPSELFASMLRNSGTSPTDDSPSLQQQQVSPGTPTSSQAHGTSYDVIYNNSQQLANAFFNGGM